MDAEPMPPGVRAELTALTDKERGCFVRGIQAAHYGLADGVMLCMLEPGGDPELIPGMRMVVAMLDGFDGLADAILAEFPTTDLSGIEKP